MYIFYKVLFSAKIILFSLAICFNLLYTIRGAKKYKSIQHIVYIEEVREGGVIVEQAYRGFLGTAWKEQIDVRDFIQQNYTPYEGDETFLAGATARTEALNRKYEE